MDQITQESSDESITTGELSLICIFNLYECLYVCMCTICVQCQQRSVKIIHQTPLN